jgi:hypothetical protein
MILEQDLRPGAFRFCHLAAGNDGRTGALQGIRTDAITGRRRHPIALDGNRLALGNLAKARNEKRLRTSG